MTAGAVPDQDEAYQDDERRNDLRLDGRNASEMIAIVHPNRFDLEPFRPRHNQVNPEKDPRYGISLTLSMWISECR